MVHGLLLADLRRMPNNLALRALTARMVSMGTESTMNNAAENANAHLQELSSRKRVATIGPMNVVMRVGDELNANARTRSFNDDVSAMMISRM